jgi:hypothetical protein
MSTGQNILPPPIPQNAEIKAPTHPIVINNATFLDVSFNSPSEN